MKPTDWAAWIGATTGVCAVIWDFIKWKTAGPKLRVRIYRDLVRAGPVTNPPSKYLEFVIHNNGTASTTITMCAIHSYDSWFAKMIHKPSETMIVGDRAPLRLPHLLGVGEEWTVLCLQDEDLQKSIDARKSWGAVYHSWSGKPIEMRIEP